MKPRHADHAFNPRSSEPGPEPLSTLEFVKAAPLALSADMTVPQAFHAILANCVEQVRGNEAGVSLGADPESVHQMRVGLRRLRSAFRLFRDIASPTPRLRSEIDWLFSQLSEVRDWEVLAGITLPLIGDGVANEPSLAAVQKSVTATARKKRRRASTIVQGARFAKLMHALNAWADELATASAAPGTATTPDEDMQEFAERMLKGERKRLLRRGRRMRDDDVVSRHHLRIAAKRTRYAYEFFAALYSGKRMKAYIARLQYLLDCLGRLNDFAVAERLLSELPTTDQNMLVGASYARGYLAAETKRLCRKLDKRWKQVNTAKTPSRNQ